MIRMGRSSRPEQSNDNNYQPQTPSQPAATPYQYAPAEPVAAAPSGGASPRAVTDSESMARDIKEGRLSGFVGHGTTLTGETNFQAMLRVDGHLVGTVTSESGTLIVGSNGQVDANISVSAAMVNGVVNGDIVATEKIQLGRTARVVGNVTTPRLILEDGAMLEGGCTMLKAREQVEKRETQAQEQYQAQQTSSYQPSDEVEADDDDSEAMLLSADDDDAAASEAEEDEKVEAALI